MGEERLVKSKFLLTATLMEEVTDEEGNKKLKVAGQINDQMRGKDFTRSMYEDKLKDIEHKIEIVNTKPEQFQFNVIYILADGTRMWVWLKKPPLEVVDEPTEDEAEAINDAAAGEQQTIESEGEN